MIGTVDFNMILELNRFLKKEGYDYSVHSMVDVQVVVLI